MPRRLRSRRRKESSGPSTCSCPLRGWPILPTAILLLSSWCIKRRLRGALNAFTVTCAGLQASKLNEGGHDDRQIVKPLDLSGAARRPSAVSSAAMAVKLPEENRYLNRLEPTPLVPVRVAPGRPLVWAKLEFLNPSGSTKDRIARFILEKAWRQGRLRPGDTVTAATSIPQLPRSLP